jgi:hypothetical protein
MEIQRGKEGGSGVLAGTEYFTRVNGTVGVLPIVKITNHSRYPKNTKFAEIINFRAAC